MRDERVVWIRLVAFATVLLSVVASCSDDAGDGAAENDPGSTEVSTSTTEGPSTSTTEGPSTSSQPAGEDEAQVETDADVALDWTLATSFDGRLENPVTFGGGFAAVHDPGTEPGGGELWFSEDAVAWEAAPGPPPGSVDQLFGQGDDLFALQSSADSSEGGLWVLADGTWREVMGDARIDGAAVGPDRIVVYHDGTSSDPFELLGVFDTETLEPVEFSGLPDLGVAGLLYEGRVTALDDGFLAVVSWIVTPEEAERRILHSADGSTWIEHPTVTADEVDVWNTSLWPAPASYGGLDLVAGPRVRPQLLLRTSDGLQFEDVVVPLRAPVANNAGFFAFTAGNFEGIHHSTDGVNWRSLQTPPTWTGFNTGSGVDQVFASGTVIVSSDELVAVVIRGDMGDWGVVDNPMTEIWRTAISDL